MKVWKSRKIGVALGGGAARGLAHLGVLKVLQQEGLPIHYLGGVSVGSIIAAGVAAGLTVDDLIEKARGVTWRHLGRWSLSFQGFNRNDRMADWLEELLPVRTFEELEIPLRIVATDLTSGKPLVLERGPLFPAIQASCAIPGLYVPVAMNGSLLADGYLTCSLPVREVREMGADLVIASAIGLESCDDVQLNNLYQILLRSFSIMSAAAQKQSFDHADIVVRPEIASYSWSDLTALGGLVEAGELAARAQLDRLRRTAFPPLWQRLRKRWRQSLRPGGRQFSAQGG